MKTQTDSRTTVTAVEPTTKTENPLQERHIGEVAESIEATAEDVLTARKLETQDEAGSVFVP